MSKMGDLYIQLLEQQEAVERHNLGDNDKVMEFELDVEAQDVQYGFQQAVYGLETQAEEFCRLYRS